MPTLLAQTGSTWSTGWTILVVAVLLVLLIIFGILFQFVGLYIRAWVSGARVSFAELIAMRLRKFNTTLIVNSRIQAVGAGLQMPLTDSPSRPLQAQHERGAIPACRPGILLYAEGSARRAGSARAISSLARGS